MMSRSTQILVLVSVLAVSLLVFAGAALAQDEGTGAADGAEQTPVEWMQSWMGPEAWGEMIGHMTRIHGAEATGEMLQEMNETGSCHGSGFMGNWNGQGTWGTMMNGVRDMMGGFNGMGGMMGR